ncbi:MAG TPA: hypothetical protein VF278_06840 [Pirellulales bacterium]
MKKECANFSFFADPFAHGGGGVPSRSWQEEFVAGDARTTDQQHEILVIDNAQRCSATAARPRKKSNT